MFYLKGDDEISFEIKKEWFVGRLVQKPFSCSLSVLLAQGDRSLSQLHYFHLRQEDGGWWETSYLLSSATKKHDLKQKESVDQSTLVTNKMWNNIFQSIFLCRA